MDPRLSFLYDPPTPTVASTSVTKVQAPIECAFEHRNPGAEGWAAMQYWPPAQDGHLDVAMDDAEQRSTTQRARPAHLTLFILGNPGLLNYYLPFLNHLHSLLPCDHAILSTSHIGHDPRYFRSHPCTVSAVPSSAGSGSTLTRGNAAGSGAGEGDGKGNEDRGKGGSRDGNEVPVTTVTPVTRVAPETPLTLDAQLRAKVELVRALRGTLDAWGASEERDKVSQGHTAKGAESVEEDEAEVDAELESSTPAPGPSDSSSSSPRDTRRTQIDLVGHSVGAWLACEVFKIAAPSPTSMDLGKAVLLFPTLGWIADSFNGRVLWPIFHRPLRPLLPILSPLLFPILPFTLFPAPTLALLRSPRTIAHVLALARSEMDSIRDLDESWFVANKNRVRGVWSKGGLDGWVGKDGGIVRRALGGETVEEGEGQGEEKEGERVKILDGVPHAFCLTEEHSRLVAEVVAGFITDSAVRVPRSTVDPPLGSSAVPM